jgi:hypothetical protein
MAEKKVPLIKAEKIPRKDVTLDSNGFFVIEIDRNEKQIRVEYFTNVYRGKKIVSGNLQKVFVGNKADALSDTISKNVPKLLPEHYMYLGRELQRAQCTLKKNEKYFQGGC